MHETAFLIKLRQKEQQEWKSEQKPKYIFFKKNRARICTCEKKVVILHPLFNRVHCMHEKKSEFRAFNGHIIKQTKNINKHANNQTETWIGHSV